MQEKVLYFYATNFKTWVKVVYSAIKIKLLKTKIVRNKGKGWEIIHLRKAIAIKHKIALSFLVARAKIEIRCVTWISLSNKREE